MAYSSLSATHNATILFPMRRDEAESRDMNQAHSAVHAERLYTVPHLYCTPCREADAQLHSKHDHERTHHGTHAAQRPKPSNGIRPAPEFGTRPHIPFRRNGIC